MFLSSAGISSSPFNVLKDKLTMSYIYKDPNSSSPSRIEFRVYSNYDHQGNACFTVIRTTLDSNEDSRTYGLIKKKSIPLSLNSENYFTCLEEAKKCAQYYCKMNLIETINDYTMMPCESVNRRYG